MKVKHINSLLVIVLAFSLTGCVDEIPLPKESIDTCVESTNVISFQSRRGKKYELVKEPKRWKNAAICAVKRGGYLAEINDGAEQVDIFKMVTTYATELEILTPTDGGGGAYIWIGANNFVLEKRWVWDGDGDNMGQNFWFGDSRGEPVDGLYNNWGINPDISTDHNAVAMAMTSWDKGEAGNWNDLLQENYLYFVIEYDE